MNMKSPTPAPGEIGHNSLIPTPEQVTFEMQTRFEELFSSTATLLEEARGLPEKVTDRADLGNFARIITRIRELAKGVAVAFNEQRKALEYPLLKESQKLQKEAKAPSGGGTCEDYLVIFALGVYQVGIRNSPPLKK